MNTKTQTGDKVRVLESANSLYAGEGVVIQAYLNSWSHLVKMETGRMAGHEGAFRFRELVSVQEATS